MRVLLGLVRLISAVLHVLHGMLVMTRFPKLAPQQRHDRIRWWSQGLLKKLGLSLHVTGVAPHAGATLVVANHVSWLDILAIHSAAPHVRFVSKADVLAWPLLGWLIKSAGTLFIERERKRDAVRVVHATAAALQAGDSVAVFPEGTTGLGPELLPFHANLLQAAVATETPVQPIVLRFFDPTAAFSPAVAFVGDTTLLQSIWAVVCAQGLQVQVQVMPPVGTRHADRRALSEHLRSLVAHELAAQAAPAAAA